MKSNILRYKHYYLRPLTVNDVTVKYVDWLKDEEVTKYLEIRFGDYSIDELKSYIELFLKDKSKFLFGIFFERNDSHIGNMTIYDVNYKTGTFDIGYLIGDKNHWGTSASTEAILLALKYAFNNLNLRKIFTGVYSNHVKSRFTLKKIGFVEEARLKDRFLFDGETIDEVIVTMDREQWKDLKKKFAIK
jgi:RimJ/RimL family protein N-acetyltransferase